ncbi:deoxynucleotidyltransferase terminal-interacting protein 1 [Carlito syrichta]|uniref:Deoxynucleotidyltransferase terminal-interacting protein 1 n=1 Tax=Carlito syrichta TaxID=1868482 RepID=A0A1U7TSS5_CARSF|nr:deoxynucleotidyltransferase terminal-interacting protein 1 [Carlito syrichta]
MARESRGLGEGRFCKNQVKGEDEEENNLEVRETKIKGKSGRFFTVRLPIALDPGAKISVTVETVYTHVLQPYPTQITQSEKQFVVFEGNHYFYSPYPTKAQTMRVKLASRNVESYTKLGNPTRSEDLLDYGPFRDIPAYSQAKLLFSDGEKVIPRLTHELPGIKRGRQAEEECAHRGSPIPKKRKGRPPGHILSNDRAATGMVWKPKSCEPIRREGPKWDPARLNESTTFVLGSRANKALGMGGTRGRIYIKHPHLFKYAADPQDKHWLAEQHHMRATGGKMAYLLIEEDIRDLAASDDYRGCLDLKLDELKSFVLPSWMVEKMRKYMETLRTENEHRAVEAPPQT